MRTVVHLARADAWRTRWLWGLWLLLTVLHRLVADLGPGLLANAPSRLGAIGTGSMYAELACFWLAVSIVVHADPVGDARAFWRSRPIGPAQLWLAKGLVLTAALVAVPVVVDAARLAFHGAPPTSIVVSAAQATLTRGTWLAVAWLMASVTRSTIAFIVAVGGTLATLVLSLIVLIIVSEASRQHPRPERLGFIPPLPLADDTGAYAASLLWVLSGGALVWWQYRHARWLVSSVTGVALVAASLAVAAAPLPPLAAATPPEPPAWSTSPASTPVVFADSVLKADEHRRVAGLAEPHVPVRARLEFAGIPVGESAIAIVEQTRFTRPDGAVIVTPGHDGRYEPLDNDPLGRLRKALPSSWRPPADDADIRIPPRRELVEHVIATIPQRTAATLTGQSLTVESMAELRLTKVVVAATCPVVPSVLFEDEDHRVELLRVLQERGKLLLAIRQIRFAHLRPAIAPHVSLILRDRSGPAFTGLSPHGTLSFEGLPGFSLQLSGSGMPWTSPWGAQWQEIGLWGSDWPASWLSSHASSEDVDRVLLDVVVWRFAGSARRTIRGEHMFVRIDGAIEP